MTRRDLPGEIWLPVVGYEGLYEVSNRGRVWSVVRSIPSPRGGYRTIGGRLLRTKTNRGGYEMACLYSGGSPRQSKHWQVHQLVMLAFVGPAPEGQEVRHGELGQTVNHWPENLSYGTKIENQADRLRDGTAPRGEQNGRSKLTEAQVRGIRASVGASQRELAEHAGVAPSTISMIKSNTNWRAAA